MKGHAYIKLRNLEALYKLDTGGLADIATGGLYFITWCDDAAAVPGAANSMYNFSVTSRLRYYDA